MKTDLAIIGGGCGALWLHHLATQSRRDACLLLPNVGYGGYASLNGQARAHNGALYITGDTDLTHCSTMVSECAANKDLVKRHLTTEFDGLHSGEFGYYLFHNRDSFDRACSRLALFPEVSWSLLESDDESTETQQLRGLFPASPYIIRTDEPAFSQEGILTRLMTQIRLNEGWCSPSFERVEDIDLEPDGCDWTIVVNGSPQLTASRVVFALGALNPHVEVRLQQKLLGRSRAIALDEVDRSIVMSWRDRVFRAPVALQDLDIGKHLSFVPQENATTITSGGLSDPDPAVDPNDFEVWTGGFDILEQQLRRYFGPASQASWELSMRVCQKSNNVGIDGSSHSGKMLGQRHYFWSQIEEVEGVTFFYPGKWSLAARAADVFLQCFESASRDIEDTALISAADRMPSLARDSRRWPTYVFEPGAWSRL